MERQRARIGELERLQLKLLQDVEARASLGPVGSG